MGMNKDNILETNKLSSKDIKNNINTNEKENQNSIKLPCFKPTSTYVSNVLDIKGKDMKLVQSLIEKASFSIEKNMRNFKKSNDFRNTKDKKLKNLNSNENNQKEKNNKISNSSSKSINKENSNENKIKNDSIKSMYEEVNREYKWSPEALNRIEDSLALVLPELRKKRN